MLQSLTDTLTCDSSLLHQYRSDEAYDYARELHAPDVNLWEWLMQKIGELLNDIFSINDKGDIRIIIYIGLSLVFIGIIAFLMYRFQPKLFSRSGRLKGQNTDEDNIYGVDFEKEYAKAMEHITDGPTPLCLEVRPVVYIPLLEDFGCFINDCQPNFKRIIAFQTYSHTVFITIGETICTLSFSL